MPPGPRGYPLLGNMLQLDLNDPVEKLAKWRKEFGDIFTINLIGQDIVVVSCIIAFEPCIVSLPTTT